MEYNARLEAPSQTNKNYIHYTKGGYNYCIQINKKTGSCLPNCVGFAWGRWRELLGEKPKLCKDNAEKWYGYNDGYKRGQTPKIGAVICWRKGTTLSGKDGAGHVAIVEENLPNGVIVTSNSAYNGTRFYTKKLKPPYSIGKDYHFQGFIYNPKEYDEQWTTGDYILTNSKYIRTSPKVTANNYVLVKECMASVKPKLTSSKPNDKAKFKVGAKVKITKFEYDSKGYLWGKMVNSWICLYDKTPQAKRVG